MAADSGEIDGGCWAWESIKVMWRQGLDAAHVNIVLQVLPKQSLTFSKVPAVIELAKTKEARKLIQVGIHDTATITRPYGLPLGAPIDRVQRLSGHDGANDSSQATNSNKVCLTPIWYF